MDGGLRRPCDDKTAVVRRLFAVHGYRGFEHAGSVHELRRLSMQSWNPSSYYDDAQAEWHDKVVRLGSLRYRAEA